MGSSAGTSDSWSHSPFSSLPLQPEGSSSCHDQHHIFMGSGELLLEFTQTKKIKNWRLFSTATSVSVSVTLNLFYHFLPPCQEICQLEITNFKNSSMCCLLGIQETLLHCACPHGPLLNLCEFSGQQLVIQLNVLQEIKSPLHSIL